ncbi:MAG: hypothetical protein ACR2JP_11825 [Acidimicrobiia bacterium]
MKWFWIILLVLLVVFLLWWLLDGRRRRQSSTPVGSSSREAVGDRDTGGDIATGAGAVVGTTGATHEAVTMADDAAGGRGDTAANDMGDMADDAADMGDDTGETATDAADAVDDMAIPSDEPVDDLRNIGGAISTGVGMGSATDDVAGTADDDADTAADAMGDTGDTGDMADAAADAMGDTGDTGYMADADVADTAADAMGDTGETDEAGMAGADEDDSLRNIGGLVAEIPDGPYGSGSAVPAEDGSGPAGYEIKGNADLMLYHTPDSPYYERTRADVWFDSEATAGDAGFTRWDEN